MDTGVPLRGGCETNSADYIFGLAGSKPLRAKVEEGADAVRTRRAVADTDALRGHAETAHRAKSCTKARRVIARIEATRLGLHHCRRRRRVRKTSNHHVTMFGHLLGAAGPLRTPRQDGLGEAAIKVAHRQVKAVTQDAARQLAATSPKPTKPIFIRLLPALEWFHWSLSDSKFNLNFGAKSYPILKNFRIFLSLCNFAKKMSSIQVQNTSNADASIGAILRTLRKSRGLTLADLSLVTGRSQGKISQVERGLSEVSITDLRRFAKAFDVPMGLFFHNEAAPESERGLIVRGAARHALGTSTDGLIEELLSPDLGGAFEMVRSTFEPGAELPDYQRRQTEEAGYVVSGILDIWMGERLFRLKAGDSFRLNGVRFRWRNPGEEAAVVIWVISPPVY